MGGGMKKMLKHFVQKFKGSYISFHRRRKGKKIPASFLSCATKWTGRTVNATDVKMFVVVGEYQPMLPASLKKNTHQREGVLIHDWQIASFAFYQGDDAMVSAKEENIVVFIFAPPTIFLIVHIFFFTKPNQHLFLVSDRDHCSHSL